MPERRKGKERRAFGPVKDRRDGRERRRPMWCGLRDFFGELIPREQEIVRKALKLEAECADLENRRP